MLREKRIAKKILAMLMIVAILLPYSSEVLAAGLSQTAETANFQTTTNHPGGENDYLDFVSDTDITNYTYAPYSYRVSNSGGTTQVFKLRVKDDNNFENELYCLNASKSFPSDDSVNYEYRNIGSIKTSTTGGGSRLVSTIGESNYAALVWLVNHMYLRTQVPEEKEEFIKTVFADIINESAIPPVTASYIGSLLTSDDIEVAQQYAIWYFTNGNASTSGNTSGYNTDYYNSYVVGPNASTPLYRKYNAFGSVTVSGATTGGYKSYTDLLGNTKGTARQTYITKLFDYLVTNAKAHAADPVVTYPSFAMQNSDINVTVDGDYYKVGPFKVNSGTGTATIKLVDRNGAEIDRTKYEILKAGESDFTNQNVNQIFDTNYYIYLPIEGNTITKVKLTIDYTSTETEATYWEPTDATMQPVTLITRAATPHSDEREKEIENRIFDLALRKYIVKIGDTDLTNRTPNVDPSSIASTGTATYKHVKTPITVEPGTNVVFELRVYNEGTLDGTATEITDYLPAGMTLTPYTDGDGSINDTYKWVPTADGKGVKTTYLSTKTINSYSGTGDLNSDFVRIECTIASDIADNITNRLTLTNVAEITGYSRTDNDSSKSINPDEITDSWRGDSSNKTDLTDPNYHYKGKEDDDDFEKISIDPLEKKLDLALRKYIIKVGDTATTARTPNVSTSSIASTGTATYKHAKNPLVATAGSKVVFEIRVYNEGEKAGTATEITDFLPEGMTMTPYTEGDGSINDTYKWVPSDDGRSAKTDYLKDSTINAYSGSGSLDSLYVQIECTIASDIADTLAASKVLTNVAAITGYSEEDKDSSAESTPSAITDTYSGNTSNKADLSDSNYFYKGQEDDDDFEKVQINPLEKEFDLALKKFITKINGQAVATSREPVVDTSKLKDGTSKDATYTMPKTALAVKKGDIVTYTIRVYNEGERAGYAEEVSDFLPAGLGYLMNYKANVTNKWAIPEGAQTIKLSEVENGTANLKADDFTAGTTALADQIVVKGSGKFTSTKLASTSTDNLIPAFDATNNKLSYKDIEVTCIVLSDEISNNNLRNIAEVAKNTDENKQPVTDRDSIPGTVDPNNYPDGEKTSNDGKTQDDHDYENLTTPSTKDFDLALQKFITKLNNDSITNRVPTITKNADGTFRYSHSSEALPVGNNNEITYTIRVYNEGDIDGYAKEVMDDIPTGLVFLPEHSTNKAYEWKMYDKDGKETTDVKQAVQVKTNYLSKEKETDSRQNLIKAYDANTMQTPAYRDVQIVFKVAETALTDKTKRDIINTAEITDDQDKDGNSVDDKDSTPGNKKDGEDDIDREKVNVKYFDLALKKTLAKIVITENGKTREIVPANENDLLKVEINRKYLSTTTVKFVYNITVTNEGQIAGYAKEIKDYIPKGLVFNQNDNPNWTPVSADVIRTEALASTLLEPGKSATVPVTLEWNRDENNLGEKINVAEISKDQNDYGSPDIDSTPDNQKSGEDDIDDAPVILSISTGEEPVYVVLSTTVLVILATGIALIKKYVLI